MEKVGLPIKTKVAAWIMILMGIIGGIFVALLTYLLRSWHLGSNPPSEQEKRIEMLRTFLPYVLLLFLPGLFLLKRKKWAWWFTIFSAVLSDIIYFISSPFFNEVIYPIFYGYPHRMMLLFIPLSIVLILLLLDRKNFFKIAS
jgi:uncharacterized protein YneF (UPF0154 family)